jgi:hypothetical protein
MTFSMNSVLIVIFSLLAGPLWGLQFCCFSSHKLAFQFEFQAPKLCVRRDVERATYPVSLLTVNWLDGSSITSHSLPLKSTAAYCLNYHTTPTYLPTPYKHLESYAVLSQSAGEQQHSLRGDHPGRWLLSRIQTAEILQRVSEHTLTHPIRHGARVPLPRDEELSGYLWDIWEVDQARPY